MGLLLLQRKEWQKQMDEQKSAVIESQEMLQQEKAAHLLELTESQKREEAAKKALDTERQCVADVSNSVSLSCQQNDFLGKESGDVKRLNIFAALMGFIETDKGPVLMLLCVCWLGSAREGSEGNADRGLGGGDSREAVISSKGNVGQCRGEIITGRHSAGQGSRRAHPGQL
jgi:hypothetical protein